MSGQPVKPCMRYVVDCMVRSNHDQVSGRDVHIVHIGAWPSRPLCAYDIQDLERSHYVTCLHNLKLWFRRSLCALMVWLWSHAMLAMASRVMC